MKGRYVLLYVVAVAVIWSIVFVAESTKAVPQTAVLPPPIRTEWRTYPVGGMMLGRVVKDSVQTLLLPSGSILLVPKGVVTPLEIEERDAS